MAGLRGDMIYQVHERRRKRWLCTMILLYEYMPIYIVYFKLYTVLVEVIYIKNENNRYGDAGVSYQYNIS